jgi:predicted lactoylglutathione lyase
VFVPYDGESATVGNGNMTGISLESTEDVDAMYAKAMELGATDEGEPGQRVPTFYGAYVRDPDGNKLTFYKMG